METEKNIKRIKITTPYIKLDQLLKFSGVVSYGTDAKLIISSGFVKVNGEKQLCRGKKLYNGDSVNVEYYDEEQQKNEKYDLVVCE